MHELRTLLPYFRPYRRGVVWGLVCIFFANAFQIASPFLMKLAIDGLADPDITAERIAGLGGLIVAAALVAGVFRYGMREIMNGISRRIEADLRNDFFRHLLRLDATFYGGTRTGDLMSRATNDTLAVRMAAGPAVMYSVNTLLSFVFALTLMIWISPRLTLVAMVPMVVLPLLVLRFGRVIHRRFESIQEQFSALSTFVQESLTGVRIVRAYGQEGAQASQFDGHNEEYRSANMRLALKAGAFHPALRLISGMALVLVAWLGGIEVIAGRITLGDFVAFGFYLTMLIWPMIALGWVVNLFQRAAASMGRLNRILTTEPAVGAESGRPPPTAEAAARPKSPVAPVPPRRAASIEFRGVRFRYPGSERKVLEDVSFVADAGQTVAIVGPTGSGKSTLVSLIPRLYDATDGIVLLDGVPLTDLDAGALRRQIGVVPQDPFLFSDTIEGNIGLGLEGDSAHASENDPPDRVLRAATIAQLHEQILDFPARYETVLGERGINLSGGQKQRATLARALAREPRILILDDALSAVDTHTEAAILSDLRSATRAQTAFIISHRVNRGDARRPDPRARRRSHRRARDPRGSHRRRRDVRSAAQAPDAGGGPAGRGVTLRPRSPTAPDPRRSRAPRHGPRSRC